MSQPSRRRLFYSDGVGLDVAQFVQVEVGVCPAADIDSNRACSLGRAAPDHGFALCGGITKGDVEVGGAARQIRAAEGDHLHSLDLDCGIAGCSRIPVNTRLFSHEHAAGVAAGVQAPQDIHIFGLQVQEAVAVTHNELTCILDVHGPRGDQLDES